jgi:hypothetical protein
MARIAANSTILLERLYRVANLRRINDKIRWEDEMKRIAAVAALACMAVAGQAGATSFMSWQGKWKLNTEKTHYPAEIAVTSNDVEVTSDDAVKLKYTGKVTVGGKEVSASYSGAWDGRPHDAGNGQTLAYDHVSNTTFKSVRKNADGSVAERSRCTFTDHGAGLTCHIDLSLPGKTVTFDEYFDKVS